MTTMTRILLAACILGNVALCQSAKAVSILLDFSAPVVSAVKDATGLGTGFTNRLAGTGSDIPTNDPNMDLSSSPGSLLLTSTHSNLGGLNIPSSNRSTAEAPGFFVTDVDGRDFQVSAGFRNISVPNGNDQTSVYAAFNGSENVRASVHELNAFVLSVNDGTGDVNVFSALGIFATGDDIDLTLSRSGTSWVMSWNNLTQATSGSLPAVSAPFLDVQNNLYFGVHAANAGAAPGGAIVSFVAEFDYFSLNVVPEPSSLALLACGLTVLFVTRRISTAGNPVRAEL